uniref:DNA-directed RNA polymerase III subunit RPC5 C-terminal domain-containing protein n=1 Tax=Sinocyclocheilus rhinocerous TaxID=307959 RepID=A0A673IZI2_9TELE
MASGDDDDPIIQEIDVYLARSLVEKLYLFQYPVRPASMSYENVTHLAARIKPKQQKVELEVAMDTMSPNYCGSKGEQIALNVDGTSSEDSNVYSTKMMDKQTFSSIQATTNTSRYAAAVFHKGELHLTPLQGILQMRPSFTYLDKADTKHREREAANEAGDSSQDEAEDDVKQITVRFSRPESEQARQRRIQSYEFLQKKQAEEPWVHLHYHGVKDGRSEHERQYLYCQAMDTAENTELVKTPREYLSMLMPPLAEEKVAKPMGPSNVLSMAQLRTLPLGEQVKTLMKNVKVMPFANLMGLLASGTDSTAVLRCIQQVALLVQGNWVVKSDVLYPKNICSSQSGVPAEVLCRGRDFVMQSYIYMLYMYMCQDVKDFLEQMSVPRLNRGWEFLLPTDYDFVRKHPDVAQRQHMLWLGIQSKYDMTSQNLTLNPYFLYSMKHKRTFDHLKKVCRRYSTVYRFPPQSNAATDEQKVFGLWESGETFDKHRQVLFEIFMKNYRVRRNVIQSRLTQELGDAVTKTDVDRLLKECCMSLGGMWYLKGTVPS